MHCNKDFFHIKNRSRRNAGACIQISVTAPALPCIYQLLNAGRISENLRPFYKTNGLDHHSPPTGPHLCTHEHNKLMPGTELNGIF